MSTIGFEKNNHIVELTINSPPANALSSTLIADISHQLDEIEKDPQIKAVVLKGEGRFFSAGADIKEFTSLDEPSEFQSLSSKGQAVFDRIEQFSIPVIAAIHGAALGGGLELAMSCHMRVVSETAKMGMPELTLGIIPGFSGTQRLPQLVGAPKAYEMILTSEPIEGLEAAAVGLANFSVSEDEVFSEATALAQAIAEKSKPTVSKTMELISYAKNGNFSKGAQLESEAFGTIFGSHDAEEGIQAFIEKRKPNFRDK